jgi:hypothetical protein
MTTTNDSNEGALGHLQVTMRQKPCLTLLHYNSMMLWKHNLTAEFTRKHFRSSQYAYLHQKARKLDSLGLEKQHCRALAAVQKKEGSVELNTNSREEDSHCTDAPKMRPKNGQCCH